MESNLPALQKGVGSIKIHRQLLPPVLRLVFPMNLGKGNEVRSNGIACHLVFCADIKGQHRLSPGIKTTIHDEAASVSCLWLLPKGIQAHSFFQIISDIDVLLQCFSVQEVCPDQLYGTGKFFLYRLEGHISGEKPGAF